MSNNKTRLQLGLIGAVVLTVAGVWAAGDTAQPQLRALSAKAGRRITTLTIETSDPVPYLTSRPDPLTLLVDLRQVDLARLVNSVTAPEGVIAAVSVENALSPDGTPLARVRIRLTQPASHQVRAKRNLIYVDFDSAFPLGTGGASPTSSIEQSGGAGAPRIQFATSLDAVRADAEPNGASVTLTGNGELAVESVTALGGGTPRVVLEFPNLRSKTPADVVVARGPVSAIHVTTTGGTPTTRVTVDLIRPASYRVIPAEDGGRDLKIFFDDTVKDEVGSAQPTAVASATDPLSVLLASPRGAAVPGRAPLALQQPGAPVLPSQPVPPMPTTSITATPGRFNGNPVTLDFTDADLRAVLRTFADISGLNVVIDPKVDGKVNLSLHEVPWDQALDIILRSNGLGYEVDGTVVRIAPVSVFTGEKTIARSSRKPPTARPTCRT